MFEWRGQGHTARVAPPPRADPLLAVSQAPDPGFLRMRLPPPLRLWTLLAATLAWFWAGSVFTPWAADIAPRLWLYDGRFYLGFVLLAWAGAEVLRLVVRRDRPPAGARWKQGVPLAMTLLSAAASLGYQHTEAGLRWRIRASSDALAAAGRAGVSNQRRRAGHFLVDSVRLPCSDAQAWLWLGRPHGAGSGINLALVRGGGVSPGTPAPDAFAFWRAVDDWWLGYQHAGRYHRGVGQPGPGSQAACRQGRVLSQHRQGLAFVAAGRRSLPGMRR